MSSTPRFFCESFSPGRIALPADESRHATHSLRLRDGEPIELFDGGGNIGFGRLVASNSEPGGKGRRRESAAEVIVERVAHFPAPRRRVSLIVASPKGDRLDWMVEKCTELGVWGLTLAEFERSVVHPRPAQADKLRRTAIEACKQCRRAWLPRIAVGVTLAKAIAAVPPDEPLLCADPDDDATPLSAWLAPHSRAEISACIIVGPEGGLTPVERNNPRLVRVRLAPYILRIETAAIAAVAAWAMG